MPYRNKLECLPLWFTCALVSNIWVRLEPTKVEPLTVLYSNGRLLALPTNIKQGWKWLKVANALAYYDMTTITAVKSFIVQAPDLTTFWSIMLLIQAIEAWENVFERIISQKQKKWQKGPRFKGILYKWVYIYIFVFVGSLSLFPSVI